MTQMESTDSTHIPTDVTLIASVSVVEKKKQEKYTRLEFLYVSGDKILRFILCSNNVNLTAVVTITVLTVYAV